jgi:hypothetical protein
MTASEFRAKQIRDGFGDNDSDKPGWTTADFETYEHLIETNPLPDPERSTDRLRQILAPAA